MGRGGRGGHGKRGRGGKKDAGPRYPTSLLKELGQPVDLNDRKKRGSRRAKAVADESASLGNDFYEYEEGVPEEEAEKNRRFDSVEKLEYELPRDFEDEEIDEDAAFGDEEEPEQLGGHKSSDDDDGGIDAENDEDLDEGDEETAGRSSSDEDTEDEEDDDEERYNRMIQEVTGRSHGQEHEKRRTEKIEDDSLVIEADRETDKTITIDDLLAPLQEKPGYNALRKRMRDLQRHGAPTTTPLPKVLQEKLDRKAGYEKTNEDITKWQPIVKKNREAPTISFINRVDVSLATTASMAADFKPTTTFEKEIAGVLQESGVYNPHEIEAAETLELNKLSVEEVRDRQERLAKMRNLLFRHETRAKRVKKIKSKTFHRLLKKSQKTNADILIDDPELLKEEAMKQEMKRAQERMTLKHKNTSKWAKRIIKRGLHNKDDGTRDAIAEQLREHASLTRKIHSATLDTSEDDGGEDTSDTEEERDGLVLEKKPGSKILAKAKMATLKALEGDNEAEIPTSGIFSLPFMVRAIEKKRNEAASKAAAVLEDIERAEGDGVDADQGTEMVPGKLAFGGFAQGHVRKTAEEDHELIERATDSENSEDDELPTTRERMMNDMDNNRIKPVQIKDSDLADGMVEASIEHTTKVEGPISIGATPQLKKKKKKKKKKNKMDKLDVIDSAAASHINSVISTNPTIFEAKMDGSTKESGSEKVEQEPIEVENAVRKQSKKGSKDIVRIAGRPKRSSQKNEMEQLTHNEYSMDVKVKTQEENGEHMASLLTQEELIREAFAGDDVEAEFQQLKSEAANEEGPQTDDKLDLPGWGQWTNIQKKKGPPQWMLKEQEELKKKQEATRKRRQDANVKNVIISERLDKKASKFLSSSLPFPYTSKEVFDMTMRMPIGRDYNTNQAFQSLTKPSEIKSVGVIIDPIKYEKPPLKSKAADESSKSGTKRKQRNAPSRRLKRSKKDSG